MVESVAILLLDLEVWREMSASLKQEGVPNAIYTDDVFTAGTGLTRGGVTHVLRGPRMSLGAQELSSTRPRTWARARC